MVAPLWLHASVGIAAGFAVVTLVVRLRRGLPLEADECRRCGYVLLDRSRRCPECGCDLGVEPPLRRGAITGRARWLVAVLCAIALVAPALALFEGLLHPWYRGGGRVGDPGGFRDDRSTLPVVEWTEVVAPETASFETLDSLPASRAIDVVVRISVGIGGIEHAMVVRPDGSTNVPDQPGAVGGEKSESLVMAIAAWLGRVSHQEPFEMKPLAARLAGQVGFLQGVEYPGAARPPTKQSAAPLAFDATTGAPSGIWLAGSRFSVVQRALIPARPIGGIVAIIAWAVSTIVAVKAIVRHEAAVTRGDRAGGM